MERSRTAHGARAGNAAGTEFEQCMAGTPQPLDKRIASSERADRPVSNGVPVPVSGTHRLALAFGHGARYNTVPATGTKRLDQLTTMSFVDNVK